MVKFLFYFTCLLMAGSILLGCKKNKTEEPEPASKNVSEKTCRFSKMYPTDTGEENGHGTHVKATNQNGNITEFVFSFRESSGETETSTINIQYDANHRIEEILIKGTFIKEAKETFEYNSQGQVIRQNRTTLNIHDEVTETTETFEYSGNSFIQTIYNKYSFLHYPDVYEDTIRYKKETDNEGNLLHIYEYITLPETNKDTVLLISSFTYSDHIPKSFQNISTVLWTTGLYIEEAHPKISRLLTKEEYFRYDYISGQNKLSSSYEYTYQHDDNGNVISIEGPNDTGSTTLVYECD
jgi:hypothetical protein